MLGHWPFCHNSVVLNLGCTLEFTLRKKKNFFPGSTHGDSDLITLLWGHDIAGQDISPVILMYNQGWETTAFSRVQACNLNQVFFGAPPLFF